MTGKMNEAGGIMVKLGFVTVGSHTVNTSLTTGPASITVPAGATQWLVQTKNANFNVTFDGATTATSAAGFTISTALLAPVNFPVTAGQVLWVIPVTTASTPTICYQFGKDE
jgi:hypothetical protein